MMDSDRQNRVYGAVESQMDIEVAGDGNYLVNDEYEVDLDAKTCTCPDHEYRNIECKHIVRCTLEVMWGNVDAPETQTPARPTVLSPRYDSIPEYLKSMDHWVCWAQKLHENKDGTKRWTKVPVDVENGGFASSTDSDTWTDFRSAVAHCEDPSTDSVGVGFVVSESDDVIGIDIDDCRDFDTGDTDPVVVKLLRHVDTYAEVSPSGTGVRIFVRGETDLSEGNQADLPRDAHIEMYNQGRYLTVTGRHIEETQPVIREDSGTLSEFEARVLEDKDPTTLGEYGA